jgi:NAD(P)-dependent dehydrogenase (short-subunit alcohol dehydrogenase family)
VVTVSSDAHTGAKLDLDDPGQEHGWNSWRSYANSKLANILFTRELARRLDGTGVTANCVHPGTVRTGFGREGKPLLRLGTAIARPFFLSPDRGADTIVYLASSPDVAGETGGYYVKRRRREPSAAARDDVTARRLWDISAKMTGLAPAQPAET